MDINKSRYLTFLLDSENYGIAIDKVKEIIGGMMNFTQIPKALPFLKGVINLRGKIIPLVDLRIKFDLSEKDYNERTCIIVIEIEIKGIKKLVGVVVDTVSEVLEISEDQIEASSGFEINTNSDFIKGMGKVKEKVIIILDIQKILSFGELEVLDKTIKE